MTDPDDTPTDEEVEAYILENVREGLMEFAGVDDDGSFIYRVTPLGEERVKRLLEEQ